MYVPVCVCVCVCVRPPPLRPAPVAADATARMIAIVATNVVQLLHRYYQAAKGSAPAAPAPLQACTCSYNWSTSRAAPAPEKILENNFFSRQVSVIEMQEIVQQGFMFEALESAKFPFQR